MGFPIFFIGDGVPTGNRSQRGWARRLCQSVQNVGLGVRGIELGRAFETSAATARHWRAECEAELAGREQGALVFSFGNSDMTECDGDGIRVPLFESIDVAERMIHQAAAWMPTLWIGPIPVAEDWDTLFSGSEGTHRYSFHNCWVSALNSAFRRTALGLNVPYLDLFSPLSVDPQWIESLEAGGDGMHPDAQGQEMIARIIEDWDCWQALVSPNAGRAPAVAFSERAYLAAC